MIQLNASHLQVFQAILKYERRERTQTFKYERTEYERGLGGATQRMADISSVGGLVRVLYRLLEEIVGTRGVEVERFRETVRGKPVLSYF